MNKKKRPRIKMPESPIGIASWPKLAKPDYTHKKQEGSFEVNLILSPEQVGDYKATYDKNCKELYKWCCENEGKAKLKHSPYLRFLPDTDKDGNEMPSQQPDHHPTPTGAGLQRPDQSPTYPRVGDQ